MTHVMSSFLIAMTVFACLFGGALAGLLIQGLLPEHHMRSDSKDAVKLGAGLIATMAALVLGLLVGAAKSSFDTVNAGLTQSSAKFVVLDRLLAEYGPETQAAREELRGTIAYAIGLIWPEKNGGAKLLKDVEGARGMERVVTMVRQLTPQSEPQRTTQAEALRIGQDLLISRWTLIEQEQVALPPIFLIVLVFWLTMLNVTYGLYAPRNLTVISVLLVCALSVAGSVFLITEMNRPLEGMIKVSSAPMRKAMEYLGK